MSFLVLYLPECSGSWERPSADAAACLCMATTEIRQSCPWIVPIQRFDSPALGSCRIGTIICADTGQLPAQTVWLFDERESDLGSKPEPHDMWCYLL